MVRTLRLDILAANSVYRGLFLSGAVPVGGRPNALWGLFTVAEEDCPLMFRETELPVMVATLRAAYGVHAGEPVWEDFIRKLSAASPLFARLWESGDVAVDQRHAGVPDRRPHTGRRGNRAADGSAGKRKSRPLKDGIFINDL